MNIAVQRKTQIARPLKILVPMIKDELAAGKKAGLQHFINAGAMLNEARDQVGRAGWSRWLTKNFELSRSTAYDYMRLATQAAEGTIRPGARTIEEFVRTEPRRERHAVWHDLHNATDKVNVTRLADERQARETEVNLHRELALKLIDLGYRALATRLHPDRGGSRDAMSRLNAVRDELKSIAQTRRFV